MWSWWSSLEVVQRINVIIKCFSVGWGAIGAFLAVAVLLIGFREGKLRGEADRRKQDTVNNKIATAESKATEANTKAEEADRVLAVANRKIVDLEYRNEPRQLTAAQKEQLLAALKMCQPGKVQILYVAGDVEAFAYANQLAEVFKAGQFSVIGPDAEAMDATYVSLGVHMRDRDHLPPWFNTVLAALLQVDGSTKSCRNEHVKEGEGWITVGNKTLSMGPAITIK